jgi:hypothetical protein
MNGKIRLRPFTHLPQPSNSLAQSDTNVGCHLAMMAVFFRLHFAYRIQDQFGGDLSGAGYVRSTWTRKKRLIAYMGLAPGVGVALGAVRLVLYVALLPTWPWLRGVLALLFLAVWLWPVVVVLAVWANFYYGITRDDPGHWFYWSLLLPPVQKRVKQAHPHCSRY